MHLPSFLKIQSQAASLKEPAVRQRQVFFSLFYFNLFWWTLDQFQNWFL
jgi:hypothetical protein